MSIKQNPITKLTLLKNINRLDDFLGYERHNLNHLPEEFDEGRCFYEIYWWLTFYDWDETVPFQVLLPYSEYLHMLNWAIINKDKIESDFSHSRMFGGWRDRTEGDKMKGHHNKDILIVTEIYFIISKYVGRIEGVEDWLGLNVWCKSEFEIVFKYSEL